MKCDLVIWRKANFARSLHYQIVHTIYSFVSLSAGEGPRPGPGEV